MQEGGDAPGSSTVAHDQGAPDPTKVRTTELGMILIESTLFDSQGDAAEGNPVPQDPCERTCLRLRLYIGDLF